MKGWETELAGLVQHRGAALLRYATMLCGDAPVAEDLVQDAVVTVFSRLRGPAGRAAGHGAPGAVTLVTDATLTQLEGYVRRAIVTGYLDADRRRPRGTEIRHVSADTGNRAQVTTALAVLTPKQRACVVLRFYSDLTVAEVATELGCSQSTVTRHLSDANASLGGRLDVPDGGESSVGASSRRRRPRRPAPADTFAVVVADEPEESGR